MKKLFILFALMLITACVSTQNLPSVCDNETQSKLCDISTAHNIRLEDMGNGLIVGIALAIGTETADKEDVLKAIKQIRKSLEKQIRKSLELPITYDYFTSSVYEKFNRYPGLLEIAMIYFQPFSSLNIPMYQRDRQLLAGFLDREIAILER